MPIEITVEQIRAKIKTQAAASPLAAKKMTLLAASKGQPSSVICEAIEAGVSDFGENRVQDAYDKWPAIRQAYPHIRLHLIGPLQSNKVKQALALFDVIQTVDRSKLVLALARELEMRRVEDEKREHFFPHIPSSSHLQLFIQVNTGKEPQKAGVMPEEADALIAYCQELRLPVAGLMCIPPHDQPPAPHFAFLRQMAQSHGLPELSMGMSDDFETAVRMGSTCVRIGRALFGSRNPEIGSQESS